MKRKVVKQGAATLTVSLPTPWTKKYNIKPGDEIEVEVQDKAIIITNDKQVTIETKQIDISKLHPLINRTILRSYQQGYDELKLVFDKPELIQNAQRVVNELIGFESVEQGKNYCVLRDISGSSAEEFENIYRRIFLLLKSMANDSFDWFKEENHDNLKNTAYRDIDVNKFCNFCLRHLNKKGYKDYTKTSTIFYIIQRLEEVGDGYKELINYISEQKIKPSKELLDIYQKTSQLLNLCYEFSFQHKRVKALEISNIYDNIKQDIKAQLKSPESHNKTYCLSAIKSLVDKIILIQGSQLAFIEDI
ncbi:phosphate uptake regulator PhoU [Candidatus Woesearchaeota archaeon]|nr:phosphate uptake regulator PhoU [Candidatus Woesearchaeota archaeon]